MDGMNLRALLRRQLKSDEIIELLNEHGMTVEYAFDRLHENSEDCYWAAAKGSGFQLRFDEKQSLDTIFCYVKENEGFSPIDTVLIGVPVYRTFDEARENVVEQGLSFMTPDATEDFYRNWLRVDLPREAIHYQFGNGTLEIVTLMATPY